VPGADNHALLHAFVVPHHDSGRTQSTRSSRRGIEVTTATDLNLAQFNQTLREFAKSVSNRKAPLVAFYYAGHGAQIKACNYFFLVDIESKQDPTDLILDSIDVNVIVDWIEKANPEGRNLFFLDGCRDNPYEHNSNVRLEASLTLPKGVIGLNRLGDNTVVIFSTAPGTISVDGITMNGKRVSDTRPFATAFAKSITDPSLGFLEFFTTLQFKVIEDTRGNQKPLVFGRAPEDLFLALASGKSADKTEIDPLRAAQRVALNKDGQPSAFAYAGSYALLIGVSHYQDGTNWGDLPGVRDDVVKVDHALRQFHGFETKVVWDPTHDAMQNAFRDFFSVHGRKDNARLLVYYAGHATPPKISPPTRVDRKRLAC
jgi:hypothetical protein